jgi:hypothetical protein
MENFFFGPGSLQVLISGPDSDDSGDTPIDGGDDVFREDLELPWIIETSLQLEESW